MPRDPKWASVFGTIETGRKYTTFRISVVLKNGLRIYNIIRAANNELEEFPGLYKFILDGQVKELDKRIAERV